MKSAGLFVLMPAWLALLAAAEPDPPKLSARLRGEIAASLPAYVPPPVSPVSTVAPPSDPDVLVLPKMTVRERPVPKIDAIDLLIKSARKKKLAHDYKNSLHGLDAVLNGFSIPILSPTMATRGWRFQQAQQFGEFNETASNARLSDPAAAAALQDKITESLQAIDWQNRAAGAK
jgi:hypothetical protein